MISILIFLALVGAALGSFVGAMTWRLHEKKNFVNDRSICEHCKHVLNWYDLLPIASWFMLRGKCRYCHKSIGWLAIALEVSFAALLVISYIAWPMGDVAADPVQMLLFALWTVILVILGALFVYDMRWMLLPNKLITPLAILCLTFRAVQIVDGAKFGDVMLDAILGVAVGGGFFYALFQFSNGKWIGGGDVKLGFAIGILLGPWYALVGLILAFYGSALFIIPLMVAKKVTRRSKVPFGPFLIAGFIAAFLWGEMLKDWYLGLSGY